MASSLSKRDCQVYAVVAGLHLSLLTVKGTREEAVEFATSCGRRLLEDSEPCQSDGTTECYIVPFTVQM